MSDRLDIREVGVFRSQGTWIPRYDFWVNESPLHAQLEAACNEELPYVSVLMMSDATYQELVLQRLLCESIEIVRPPEQPDYVAERFRLTFQREVFPFFLCTCGDLQCGALWATVVREGAVYRWRFDDECTFHFRESEYRAAITAFIPSR